MLFVLSRHAHSVLNLEGRVNGNPSVEVHLTSEGREQARLLGEQLAHIELDVCICTRFPRTRETADLVLTGRDVPIEVEPRLDDVNIGELEGWSLDRYREVKRALGRKQPFPGGESLDEAADRYARAYRELVGRGAKRVLVVGHEIAVRYALNTAASSDALDGPPFHDVPNATPFLFDGGALAAAADRIEELALRSVDG